jgi:antitoxin component YwqK of YwqJK toxin-antitoxin module
MVNRWDFRNLYDHQKPISMNRFPLLILLLLSFACTRPGSNKTSGRADSINHVVKEYYNEQGQLISKVTLLNGVKDGPAYTYYSNGKLSGETRYVNGMKQGIEKKYQPTGELYYERTFYRDEIHGVEKKYYKSGQLMSEMTYKNSSPGNDLKEYNQYGDLVTDYPDIVFKLGVNKSGEYVISIKFSNNAVDAKFYQGNLLDSTYFDQYAPLLPARDGVALFNLKNAKLGQVFNIVGMTTTALYSPYVKQKTYKYKGR